MIDTPRGIGALDQTDVILQDARTGARRVDTEHLSEHGVATCTLESLAFHLHRKAASLTRLRKQFPGHNQGVFPPGNSSCV
jgi:hypothetical protein